MKHTEKPKQCIYLHVVVDLHKCLAIKIQGTSSPFSAFDSVVTVVTKYMK